MLQYPTVAENFSASKLPYLLSCHAESERGNEDESPVRSTDQESTGLSEDILGHSSPPFLLEKTEERKSLDTLKERKCEQKKEESERGKGEHLEEDGGGSEEEKEGQDLTREENDGEMNAHCYVRKKYPLEIHLAVFVNPIEIRSSAETVAIKKQSTEWMMELSTLLKILHHTPVEVHLSMSQVSMSPQCVLLSSLSFVSGYPWSAHPPCLPFLSFFAMCLLNTWIYLRKYFTLLAHVISGFISVRIIVTEINAVLSGQRAN